MTPSSDRSNVRPVSPLRPPHETSLPEDFQAVRRNPWPPSLTPEEPADPLTRRLRWVLAGCGALILLGAAILLAVWLGAR